MLARISSTVEPNRIPWHRQDCERALEWCLENMYRKGDTVHLLHVVPHARSSYSGLFTHPDEHQQELLVRPWHGYPQRVSLVPLHTNADGCLYDTIGCSTGGRCSERGESRSEGMLVAWCQACQSRCLREWKPPGSYDNYMRVGQLEAAVAFVKTVSTLCVRRRSTRGASSRSASSGSWRPPRLALGSADMFPLLIPGCPQGRDNACICMWTCRHQAYVCPPTYTAMQAVNLAM